MNVVEKVPAAVKMGPNETVYREFDMPEIGEDSALIKTEIAGICGSDVKNYAKKIENVIMGHENVGIIAKAGRKWLQRKGVKEGDRVLLEHYLPDMKAFVDMKQEAGWGEPFPAITPSKVIAINWSYGPGRTFDLWLDDVQFFECQ